ncbi:hypothetical protein HRbin36_01116 [bacterium HR36]|nr:hypothetical protein HRbin36_01116 [bacterium HR36]
MPRVQGRSGEIAAHGINPATGAAGIVFAIQHRNVVKQRGCRQVRIVTQVTLFEYHQAQVMAVVAHKAFAPIIESQSILARTGQRFIALGAARIKTEVGVTEGNCRTEGLAVSSHSDDLATAQPIGAVDPAVPAQRRKTHP